MVPIRSSFPRDGTMGPALLESRRERPRVGTEKMLVQGTERRDLPVSSWLEIIHRKHNAQPSGKLGRFGRNSHTGGEPKQGRTRRITPINAGPNNDNV